MKVALSGLGEVGWVPDQSNFDLPANAITSLQNFRMKAGWAEKVKGYGQVFNSTSDVPYYLRAIISTSGRVVVHCTAQNIYADNLNGRFDVTPTGGLVSTTTNSFTSAWMNGVLVVNNGVLGNVPQYWTGVLGASGSVFADLPGWDSTWRAKGFGTLKEHWFAMGMREANVDYPHRIRFSAATLPGSPGNDWDATNPANDADARDVPGEGQLIGFALPLGDGAVVYKDQSMSLVRYTGDSSIWSIQLLPIPYGMLAPNCGVVVPGIGHAVLTQNGDLIVHDGVTSRSVIEDIAKNWLNTNIDTANFSRCYVVADLVRSEVQVCFPQTGNTYCTKAVLWNWKTGKVGIKDLPNTTCGSSGSLDYSTETFDADTVSFDSESVLTFDTVGSDLTAASFSGNVNRVLMAGMGQKIFVMDYTDLADGSNFTGYIELGSLCNLSKELKGRQLLISRVWLDIDATAGTTISVYYGAAQDPVTTFTYNSPVSLVVGTNRRAEDMVCGAYPALKFSSTGYFRVRTAQIEVTDEGEF